MEVVTPTCSLTKTGASRSPMSHTNVRVRGANPYSSSASSPLKK